MKTETKLGMKHGMFIAICVTEKNTDLNFIYKMKLGHLSIPAKTFSLSAKVHWHEALYVYLFSWSAGIHWHVSLYVYLFSWSASVTGMEHCMFTCSPGLQVSTGMKHRMFTCSSASYAELFSYSVIWHLAPRLLWSFEVGTKFGKTRNKVV